MTSPPAAVAACRVAVRRVLSGCERGDLLLAACSGGADSMALAAALAFEAPRVGRRAGLLTVDHGLQAGSDKRAAQVAEWGRGLGLCPALAVPVVVTGPGGPEAAARRARYQALAGTASQVDARVVLLGHTQDDQAETVLLALARGAGPRGIAGMPMRSVRDGMPFLRPFLEVARETTRAACRQADFTVWEDPHNTDPAYARSRLRAALPLLVQTLGPDVVANLARTARLVADDMVLLDELAESAAAPLIGSDGGLTVAGLVDLPVALRTRALRAFALRLGVPGGALSSAHIDSLAALVVAWHGQGPVFLPGGRSVTRKQGRLIPG